MAKRDAYKINASNISKHRISTSLIVTVDRDLSAAFKRKCERLGLNYNDILCKMIKKFTEDESDGKN